MKSLLAMLAALAMLCLVTPAAVAQTSYSPIVWGGAIDPAGSNWNYQAVNLAAGSYLENLLPVTKLDPGSASNGTLLTLVAGAPAWAAASAGDFSSPTARTLSLATAYQATDPTKPAVVTINLTSNASLTLGGGTTNTASIVIGSTNGVASGTGTAVGTYSNSLTGSLVVGVAINTVSTSPITFALPKGWYFSVLQLTGTVTINSAYNQALG